MEPCRASPSAVADWKQECQGRSVRNYFRITPDTGMNTGINPIPILRAAIEMTSGIPIGPPRGPQLQATTGERAVIAAILEELNAGAELQRSASQ